MTKIQASAAQALHDIVTDGMTIARRRLRPVRYWRFPVPRLRCHRL
jgi:hypothetical protein